MLMMSNAYATQWCWSKRSQRNSKERSFRQEDPYVKSFYWSCRAYSRQLNIEFNSKQAYLSRESLANFKAHKVSHEIWSLCSTFTGVNFILQQAMYGKIHIRITVSEIIWSFYTIFIAFKNRCVKKQAYKIASTALLWQAVYNILSW